MRPRHDDPDIPADVEARDLPKEARVELKTLSKDNADWVAQHLVMAGRLIDEDPELAHRHALSAARRAGRIGVVRETLAITAYASGDFALALRELRTYRRITGSNDQIALMVDSERGVGRPDRALELGRSIDRSTLPSDVQVALAIAMSGARLDLGQEEAALAELEIPQLDPNRAFAWSPDLFHAYAEVLEALGRDADSASWRERAERAELALEEAQADAELETVHVIEEEFELAVVMDDLESLDSDDVEGDFFDVAAGDEDSIGAEVTDEDAARESSDDEFVGEAVSDELPADEDAVSDYAEDEFAADEVVADEAVADEVDVDEAVDGEVDEAVAEEAAAEEAATGEAVAEEAATGEAAAEEAATGEAAADEALVDEAAAGDAATGESAEDEPHDGAVPTGE
ncbi:hypothetical protein ACFRFH_06585 [Leifsonia sp. NPDC056824]|uniref:hypothetical protein n=1 Tax=Leifsonia sp. NPDC056824 TaxID=3345953 RepID=UPI0036BDE63D